MALITSICALRALSLTTPVTAAEHLASSAAEISQLSDALRPGDSIIMTDGVWTDQAIVFSGKGSPRAPITLRAQTAGSVLLNGASRLAIDGRYLVVEGLRFEGGALASGSIIEFRRSTTNSRLTHCAIVSYMPHAPARELDWVVIQGQNNRVDHNLFKNHGSVGQTVEIRHIAGVPDRHRIDGNYFCDRPAGNGNGWETIRIGLSGVAQSSSFSVVENNLFERVNGENEAISNKSSHNTYRYNTFRDTQATLTLRHGNDALVEGNFFLGNNRPGSGGVRIVGQRHRIVGNYFHAVGDNGGGAIAINRGQDEAPPRGYQAVRDVIIAHNTIVATRGALVRFDAGSSSRPVLAENVTIANNVFHSSGTPIFAGAEGSGWTWQGNVAFGGSLGVREGGEGIAVIDPELQLGDDGLWRPTAASPLIDAARGSTSRLSAFDMDGQARLHAPDIGADENSQALVVRRPLFPADVGPAWLSYDR